MARWNSALGAAEVPVLGRPDVRERGVRFRRMAVEHHRRRRARRRLGPHIRGTEHAVVREQSVGIGQPAVRERELRVLDDRLLEELDRLVQAFFGALIQVVAALQVEIARGEVVGLACAPGAPIGIDFGRQLVGDPLGDRLPGRRPDRADRRSGDSDHR